MEARRKKKNQYERRIQECLKKDPTLNREQVEDILKSFSALDVNGDGKISRSEIVRAMQILGGNPTPEEADELLRSQDINSDGYISFEEFFNYSRTANVDMEKERMKTAFRTLDKDGNGFITLAELRSILHGVMDLDELEHILKDADSNKDGKIDYNEPLYCMKLRLI
ncbi:hypothetical protein ACJMK2_002185 [Sinanodonta woodiana]|uniref:EF-hand domain-containing protein n=1 Tax=Sinanodonta woodiana TaxID=1069815 RepID=A0ABD3XWB8_SINWO